MTGGPNPGSVAAVVVHGRANVPGIDGMWVPGCAVGGFFVDKEVAAGRGDGGGIVRVGPKDLGVGGETGIETGATKKVEGEDGVWNEEIP
jgi:hypothetical protein